MALFLSTVIVAFSILSTAAQSSDAAPSNCPCGYFDPTTNIHYTESIIVYFNETDILPSAEFSAQTYQNRYQRGWNSIYIQGANPENVAIGNSTSVHDDNATQSLQLFCNPGTPNHFVIGGGVQTVRQDIFFGTFRASFLSTPPWQGGSALSMMAVYNETESWELNQFNTEDPSLSWISMISHGQFPTRNLGVNYTGPQSLQSNGIDPWAFEEVRVDWSRDELRYFVGGKEFRNVSRDQDSQLPQTPSSLFFKHWSTGNSLSMQGPPSTRTMANVGYIRLFFNSSLTTVEESAVFATRCQLADACSVDDFTLRGSSQYSLASTLRWSQAPQSGGVRVVPKTIAITCICISFVLLFYTFLRRAPWKIVGLARIRSGQHDLNETIYEPSVTLISKELRNQSAGVSVVDYAGSTRSPSESMTPNQTRKSSYANMASAIELSSERSLSADNTAVATRVPSVSSETFEKDMLYSEKGKNIDISQMFVEPSESASTFRVDKHLEIGADKTVSISVAELSEKHRQTSKVAPLPPFPTPLQPKKQVDSLAGLIALCTLIVTAIHFNLTFSNGAISPGTPLHYQSELWARKTISSYVLNLNWIGPFLMTSSRFLIGSYLRSGNLRTLAEKTVQRPFRLIIPIAIIAMLEYFLMDVGATKWLEYLPSITWSTWPFVTIPDNFGTFVSEVLQLAYLIPNAAPQIIFNYCTGVLWTVPVQLQGSWVTIIGTIMIHEVKTPWKRFAFYAWCVLVHWYALSWGTYFYLGVLLTDLDVTYKWKPWIYSHKPVYFPLVIFSGLVAFGGLSMDMITQWTFVNYATVEYGIHPDIPTGLPISATPLFTYPQYFVPKLNGLIFSIALQVVVDLSPLIQKILSLKVFVLIFPHTFTIYLIHGFIFWSLGATVCVALSGQGLPYWLNILIVAICCYSTLFASLPILTPIVETLGLHITKNVWLHAWQTPPPRRPTLFPFPADLLQGVNEKGEVVEPARLSIDSTIASSSGAKANGDVEAGDLKKVASMFVREL